MLSIYLLLNAAVRWTIHHHIICMRWNYIEDGILKIQDSVVCLN